MVEIRTSGDKAHRRKTIEHAQDALDATSMTAAVLASCDHVTSDVRQKQQALEYLEEHVPGKHVEQVATILHTRHVPISYEAQVEVGREE